MKLPPPFAAKDIIHVIIETPKGSRNKYEYMPEYDLFCLKKTLPAGCSFAFDFGFIPGIKGGDGDPLDVIVFNDQACLPGCLVACRVLGVIKAVQKKKDEKVHNDRVLAVAKESREFINLKTAEDLGETMLEDIENFFSYYHSIEGHEFKSKGIEPADEAIKLIRKGIE